MRDLPTYIYHLAEAINWPSIQRHGLLSASALMDLVPLSAAERKSFEREQRQDHIHLSNGVEIRDQKPMPAKALSRCLVGMQPSDWYALINSKVFFWFDVARMNRQRNACGGRSQIVLTIDLARLVDRYQADIALSPINSGNARRAPATRGAGTFVPFLEWQNTRWKTEAQALGTRERARNHPPVELTIPDAVPDISQFIVTTKLLKASEFFDL
jgi:hypothetical protein